MAKIPPRFEHATFESLDDGIKKSLQAWIDQHKTGKESLMLYGKPGVGKTHAMYSLLQKAPNIKHRFYNSTEIIEDIRASFNDRYVQNPMNMLKGFDGYLFIDDFGTERLTDFVQDMFYQIINDRYINKLPTIISTNFDLSEIADRLGERVASRLAEMCFIINVTGDDRRFK